MHNPPPPRPLKDQSRARNLSVALASASLILLGACAVSDAPTSPGDIVVRRSTVLVGSITRIDSTFGEKVLVQRYDGAVKTESRGRYLLAAIPGSETRVSIAQTASSSANVGAAISSLEKVTTVSRGRDAAGRLNEISIERFGKSGPTTRIVHKVDGRLLTTLESTWTRVDGGWVMESERLAVFQDDDVVSVTTIKVDAKPSLWASTARSGARVAQSLLTLLLPSEAHAASISTSTLSFEGDEEGPCSLQFAALLAAGATMGAVCIFTGPNPLCILASVAYIGASEAWNKCMNGGEE